MTKSCRGQMRNNAACRRRPYVCRSGYNSPVPLLCREEAENRLTLCTTSGRAPPIANPATAASSVVERRGHVASSTAIGPWWVQ